jgi:hypothetical protein
VDLLIDARWAPPIGLEREYHIAGPSPGRTTTFLGIAKGMIVDLLFVGITFLLFGLTVGLIRSCERL